VIFGVGVRVQFEFLWRMDEQWDPFWLITN
jgi:hypothetical protein